MKLIGKDNIAILVSTVYYKMGIVKQLDRTEEKQIIPKKIHYCWFGRNKMPDEYERYLATWRKFCPDYEIMRWDESNYDVTKVQYVREAYENKLWAFVSDYVRLDVVYRFGGIYFDTDVEVRRPLDVLLCDGAFFGASGLDEIALGPGFGAVKGHTLIKKMKENYENRTLWGENGKLNKAPCTFYNNEVFRDFGLQIRGNYQKVNDVVIYPPEVFAPEMSYGMGECYTSKTLTVHKGGFSWVSSVEAERIEMLKKKVLQRM